MDNGTKLCHLNQPSPSNLPRTVNVCGADVNTESVTESEGLLNDSNQRQSIHQNIILSNSEYTALFYIITLCIFKPTKRSKCKYSLLLYNKIDTAYSIHKKHRWNSFTF